MYSNPQLKLADQNLVGLLRQQAHWTTGGALVEFDGAVMALGATSFPAAPFNALLCEGDECDARALLDRAESTFSASGRGFSVYTRRHADSALEVECRARGYLAAGDLAIMLRDATPTLSEPASEVRVEVVVDASGVELFARVAAESFASVGLPAALVRSIFARPERMLQPAQRLLLARIDGLPVGCALMIRSNETAGIYWVGTLPGAARRGVASACVSTLTHCGSNNGVRSVVLQASRALEPFYRRLGFSTISGLRVFIKVASRRHESTRIAQPARLS